MSSAEHPIRRLRRRLGLSQAALGRLLGVEHRAVGRWESGDRRPEPEYAWALVDLARRNDHRLALEDLYPRPEGRERA